jgi:hypothetical protein
MRASPRTRDIGAVEDRRSGGLVHVPADRVAADQVGPEQANRRGVGINDRVAAVHDQRRVRLVGRSRLEARGLAGRLLALPLRARMLLETRAVLADLEYYAEHGTPSPRKQRRLARRARRGSRQQVGARLA